MTIGMRSLGWFLLASLIVAGCGGARPYRAMAKAASSEESVIAQAEDHRLKASIREAILAEDPKGVLAVTPYAYMGHAYLVGFVDAPAAAQRLQDRVRGIDGVRSVDAYLPTKPAERSKVDDVAIKAEVKAAMAIHPGEVATRVESESLAGHVVLLGVVASPNAVAEAETLARRVKGVTDVTNFLLVPEAGYESLRPHLR